MANAPAQAPAQVPSPAQPDPLIGRTLARTYQIERLLGGGGMGAVYAARHVRTGGIFAVKILHRETASDSDIYKRFQDEARTVSALRHPHIVQVTDFDQDDDGTPFIVMEMLEGEDLYQRLCRVGRLALDQVLDIARQVGSALHAAHEKGIVHRDVKPQNIFLVRQDLADMVTEVSKVVDFGISKIRRAGGQMTRDMTILGTPQFMCPEAALGQNSQLDGRADQWSLAVILYLALSGRLPFDGENLVGVLYMVVHERPVPLKQLAPEVPDYVITAIERAMSKRKEDRFPKMLDFVRAVTGAAGNAASVRMGTAQQPAMSSALFRVPPQLAPNIPLPQPQLPAPGSNPPPGTPPRGPGSPPLSPTDQTMQTDQPTAVPHLAGKPPLHPSDVPTSVTFGKQPELPPTRPNLSPLDGENAALTVPVAHAPPELVATPTSPTAFSPLRGSSPAHRPPPGPHSGNTPTNIALTGNELESMLRSSSSSNENRWGTESLSDPQDLQAAPTRVAQMPTPPPPSRPVSATVPLHVLRGPDPNSPFDTAYPSTLSRASGQSLAPRVLHKLQQIDWARLREQALQLLGVVPRSPVRLAVAGGVLTLALVLLILWIAGGSSPRGDTGGAGGDTPPAPVGERPSARPPGSEHAQNPDPAEDPAGAADARPDPQALADAGNNGTDDGDRTGKGKPGAGSKRPPQKGGKRIKIDPNL